MPRTKKKRTKTAEEEVPEGVLYELSDDVPDFPEREELTDAYPDGSARLPEDETDIPALTGEEDRPYNSAESEMKPEDSQEYGKAVREGRRGRPKTLPDSLDGLGGMDEGILGRKPLPVPTPPHRVYSNTAISRAKHPKQAYAWWNDLPRWAKDSITAYVYRDHPVLLPPELCGRGAEKEYKYIDKIDGNQPLQDDLDLLNRYGCGSYKIVLSELGKTEKGDRNRSLLEIHVTNLGGGDYKSNPPTDRRINDLRQLDIDHPANASYIAYLRSRGIIPEEARAEEERKREEEEMAAIQAAQEQSKSIETLTRTVVELANAKATTPQQPVPPPVDEERLGRSIAREIARELAPVIQPVVHHQQPQKDPMEIAVALVNMMEQAKNSSNEEVRELRARLESQQTQTLQSMMEQIQRMAEGKTQGPAASTVTDSLSALKQMKETLREFGINIENNPAPTPESTIEKYLPVVEKGINALLMFLVQRQQQSAPQQAAVQPASAPPSVNAPAPPSTNPTQHGLPQELVGLLDQIRIPLFNYLMDSEATGESFAAWFVSGYGDAVFQQIAANGPEVVTSVLRQYPPTAAVLNAAPPGRVDQFVREFCSGPADEEPDQQEKEAATERPVS
jgi:hypothetical protein